MPSWRRCGHNRLRLTAAHSRVLAEETQAPVHTVVSSYNRPYRLDGVTGMTAAPADNTENPLPPWFHPQCYSLTADAAVLAQIIGGDEIG